MTITEIVTLQRRLGTAPDGHWGPKSIASCQSWLRALMPEKSPWPATDQASLTKYYGRPGDESRLTGIPAPNGICYEGKPVKSVRCHHLVADSLHRILVRLVADYPEIAADYAGCYNDRPMRGGSTPSLHARGAAIDFAPERNGNTTHWPTRADMPLGVMAIFAAEGWIPAGAFWGRDAMHFQATR